MKKDYQLGWCLIPPQIMGIEELSDCDKMVYGRVLGLIGNHGYCYASNSWLGFQVRKNKDTIAHSISKLKKLGLITTKVTRDDNSKITSRHIFVPIMTKSGIPIPEINNTPIPEIGIDSVESNSVEYSVTNRQSVKTEQQTDNNYNPILKRRAVRQAKKSKPFGSYYTPKSFVQYEKKKKVYVDGRGVI